MSLGIIQSLCVASHQKVDEEETNRLPLDISQGEEFAPWAMQRDGRLLSCVTIHAESWRDSTQGDPNNAKAHHEQRGTSQHMLGCPYTCSFAQLGRL